MKLKKHAKPLNEATIGDFTEHKCGFCGLYLQFVEVDKDEKLAWLSCPTFMAEREFSQNEHSSYAVSLAETGYREGDEAKENLQIKEPHDTGRLHHDRPNMSAPWITPGTTGRPGKR
jgi:hypothetical protein